jgi:hypothetical protein
VPALHASNVADWDRRRQWIDEVEMRIATGVGSHRPKHAALQREEGREILRFGRRLWM